MDVVLFVNPTLWVPDELTWTVEAPDSLKLNMLPDAPTGLGPTVNFNNDPPTVISTENGTPVASLVQFPVTVI